MAELIIHTDKIHYNIKSLNDYFQRYGIRWSLITKVFSGDIEFLENVLTDEIIQEINSIGDSRLTSLKNLKTLNPQMRTIYIKPPAKIYAEEVVEFADISLNSSYSTIVALNEAAKKMNKTHQIIIMIEMGELREGVLQGDILTFYEKVFGLSNIEVIGIGSNLGCMYGIEPTPEKLQILSDYKSKIEQKFNTIVPFISAGTSITLPLIESGTIPSDINHFRIGEAVFFGMSPLKNERFRDLKMDTFEFTANIIELEEKEIVPEGVIGDGNIGHTADFDQKDVGESSYKAILDFGMLDVERSDIDPYDESIQFVGITSDMLVVDIGTNTNPDGSKKYSIGDKVYFKPNYMGVARLLNSKFISKKFVGN